MGSQFPASEQSQRHQAPCNVCFSSQEAGQHRESPGAPLLWQEEPLGLQPAFSRLRPCRGLLAPSQGPWGVFGGVWEGVPVLRQGSAGGDQAGDWGPGSSSGGGRSGGGGEDGRFQSGGPREIEQG